jgi:hypothetical protein
VYVPSSEDVTSLTESLLETLLSVVYVYTCPVEWLGSKAVLEDGAGKADVTGLL